MSVGGAALRLRSRPAPSPGAVARRRTSRRRTAAVISAHGEPGQGGARPVTRACAPGFGAPRGESRCRGAGVAGSVRHRSPAPGVVPHMRRHFAHTFRCAPRARATSARRRNVRARETEKCDHPRAARPRGAHARLPYTPIELLERAPQAHTGGDEARCLLTYRQLVFPKSSRNRKRGRGRGGAGMKPACVSVYVFAADARPPRQSPPF